MKWLGTVDAMQGRGETAINWWQCRMEELESEC